MTICTRADYMGADYTTQDAAAARHRRYYAQFVDAAVVARVVGAIGADKLRASVDPHFNDIPLGHWDMLAKHLGPLPLSFKAAGDYATLAGLVCVAKEAARQYVEGAQ